MIVAATLDSTASGGNRGYQELHADLVDPDVTPVVDDVPGGGGEEGSFATFWLTDTPCNQTERQPLTGDHAHPQHPRDLLQRRLTTGDTPGAPDLMFTEPPKLDPSLPAGPAAPLRLCDGRRARGRAENDKGLQIRHSGDHGLRLLAQPRRRRAEPEGPSWVSPPIPDDFELLLDGEATLSLWTQDPERRGTHPGRICVFLFARKTNLSAFRWMSSMANEDITDATLVPARGGGLAAGELDRAQHRHELPLRGRLDSRRASAWALR